MASDPRLSFRHAAQISALVTLLGLLTFSATVLAAPGNHAVPLVPALRGGAPSAPSPSTTSTAAVIHPASCSGNGFDVGIEFGPGGARLPQSGGLIEVGPVPLNVSANLTISGDATVYSYQLVWGDNSSDTGSVSASTSQYANFTLLHYYSVPAVYAVQVEVNYTCGGTSFGLVSFGIQLDVFGAAGATPASVTSNVTAAPVPADVTYSLNVTAAPANATALWVLQAPIGPATQLTSSINAGSATLSTQLIVPGAETGYVEVLYPGGLVYARADLPAVNVTPLALLSATDTTPAPGSPFLVTFWANATNLSGGTYTGNATVVWDFTPPWNGTGSAGPTNGSPVQHEYWMNATGGGMEGFPVYAFLVRPDGVAIALASVEVRLNNSIWPPPSPTLSLSATAANGTSPPFAFHATASLSGVPIQNGTVGNGYDLNLGLYPALGGSEVWVSNSTNWSGGPFTVPGTVNASGAYRLVGFVTQNGTPIANANTTFFIGPPGNGSSPTLAVTVLPVSGSAPLNSTLQAVAAGGSAPYTLAVCLVGPYSGSQGSGSCSSAGGFTGWNGSAKSLGLSFGLPGNYTVSADLTDAAGQTAVANASVNVTAAPAALEVSASLVAGPSATSAGSTFGFATGVTGGVAPYTVQWSFGDGESGSGVPGATTYHTFTSSGTYSAVLKVTDARGTIATATTGAFEVRLPGASGPGPLSISDVAVVVGGLLAVASVAAIALVARSEVRRREALNWVRTLGPSEGSAESPSDRAK